MCCESEFRGTYVIPGNAPDWTWFNVKAAFFSWGGVKKEKEEKLIRSEAPQS